MAYSVTKSAKLNTLMISRVHALQLQTCKHACITTRLNKFDAPSPTKYVSLSSCSAHSSSSQICHNHIFHKYHSGANRMLSHFPSNVHSGNTSFSGHNGGSSFAAHSQLRFMSQKKNFFTDFLDNIKQEMSQNKEMKESLKKFREERNKLEQSDAIQKARQKFENIEAETLKSSAALKKTFEGVKDKLSETIEEVQKTEFAKKGKEFTEEIGKSAEKAAETISKSRESFGQTSTFKNISQGVKAVKKEIEETTLSRARTYRAPVTLRKRSEKSSKQDPAEKIVEANEDATGVVLHKDSRWFQSWQNFKDNNQYVHKLFDLKMKYDESDNVVVRVTRVFTDKVGVVFGSMFSKTEMSEVLTEICRIDPTFDKEMFLRNCEREIIPNILEAMIRGDLEILKDWCYEAPFNTLAQPIRAAYSAGYKFDSRVLDINNIDIAAGKMMEQGPVLIISFNSQQIMAVRNRSGTIVEGNPDQILRIFYVWALCRDQEELDPRAAWKLMDISASSSEQWL
ncbi:mitochondrial import inner membrane translocase subunit TIM44-like [Argonauta hians]